MISIGGSVFGNFFTTRHMCIVIHVKIGGHGMFRHFK